MDGRTASRLGRPRESLPGLYPRQGSSDRPPVRIPANRRGGWTVPLPRKLCQGRPPRLPPASRARKPSIGNTIHMYGFRVKRKSRGSCEGPSGTGPPSPRPMARGQRAFLGGPCTRGGRASGSRPGGRSYGKTLHAGRPNRLHHNRPPGARSPGNAPRSGGSHGLGGEGPDGLHVFAGERGRCLICLVATWSGLRRPATGRGPRAGVCGSLGPCRAVLASMRPGSCTM